MLTATVTGFQRFCFTFSACVTLFLGSGRMKLDLSAEGWGRVIVYTVLGTLVCVAASLYVDSFNFAHYGEAERLRAIVIDVLLPVMLAVPLLLFFTGKLRELAIAHKKLTVYASTDALTQVMNRA